MDKNNNDVNKFWVHYHSVVTKSGVAEKYADVYVKWGNSSNQKTVTWSYQHTGTYN